MNEIKKSTLHPYNDKDIDIYPKTNEEQVEDNERYLHHIYVRNTTYNATCNVLIVNKDSNPIENITELCELLSDISSTTMLECSCSGGYLEGADMCINESCEFYTPESKFYLHSIKNDTRILKTITIENQYFQVYDYVI